MLRDYITFVNKYINKLPLHLKMFQNPKLTVPHEM